MCVCVCLCVCGCVFVVCCINQTVVSNRQFVKGKLALIASDNMFRFCFFLLGNTIFCHHTYGSNFFLLPVIDAYLSSYVVY